jgi:hypothetical protein
MKHRLISLAVLMAGLIFAFAQAQSRQQDKSAGKIPAHDCSPVAELHHSIEQRFSAMDRFGIRRVILSPYHLQHFKPENETEKAVIADLEKNNWTVSFYLVGRSVLEAKPDDVTRALWEKQTLNFYARKPINNPILLTRDARIADLPKPLELWDRARQAMTAFSKTDQYDFSFGRWQMAVRPLRASQEACLKCHDQKAAMVEGQYKSVSRNLKLGDPLGAVIYAYARTR